MFSKMFTVVLCCAMVASTIAMPQGHQEYRIKALKKHNAGIPLARAPVLEPVARAPVLEAIPVGRAPALEASSSGIERLSLEDGKPQNKYVNIARSLNDEEEAKLFKKQAESAKYAFSTSVEDGIMGHAHSRSETRDGLSVVGMYSYSDGFFKRTINYEADDKGYRIVKEEVEPIGDGPVIDVNGAAIVRSSLGSEYQITLDDYQKRNGEEEEEEEQ